MKKLLLTFVITATMVVNVKAQEFVFVPQIDLSYGMMDLGKTNGFGLGLGIKPAYIFKNNHRIAVSAAYDYYWGKKGSPAGGRYPGLGHVPIRLHYAIPITKGNRNNWYIEPNGGYSILADKNTKLKGYVAGINIGGFEGGDDPSDMNIGFDIAKYNGMPGTYATVSLRFGFLSLFSAREY